MCFLRTYRPRKLFGVSALGKSQKNYGSSWGKSEWLYEDFIKKGIDSSLAGPTWSWSTCANFWINITTFVQLEFWHFDTLGLDSAWMGETIVTLFAVDMGWFHFQPSSELCIRCKSRRFEASSFGMTLILEPHLASSQYKKLVNSS